MNCVVLLEEGFVSVKFWEKETKLKAEALLFIVSCSLVTVKSGADGFGLPAAL